MGGCTLLEREFERIYFRFRLLHYRELFSPRCAKDGSLSANEACSAEVIFLLDHPTVKEFANFLKISQPNATYKVNSLIRKGYVVRETSSKDRRESRLTVTEKFLSQYGCNSSFIRGMMDNIHAKFTPEEIEQLERMMKRVADEALS